MQHPKSLLIERSKQLGLGKPTFSTRQSGPEHEPIFISDVTLRGDAYGHGEATTKRDAERLASEAALEALSQKQLPADTHDSAENDPFDGPWPIFSGVLATSLRVANSRVNPILTGTEAIDEVQALALNLYKGVLENLGEVADLDEDEVNDL
jgi:ribonuclease-3